MLRLKTPGNTRLLQRDLLEATFGGGEANVAVSLANFGLEADFLTILPENPLGDACRAELRKFGVGTQKILRGPGRMGIYFLETGANQLPSRVIYDRSYSAMALAKPGDIDWTLAFENVDWFHITGITPAISRNAMELSLEAVHAAKACGITVSCDLNYRKNLWKYGTAASSVMRTLIRYVDVAIGNEEDVQKSLGIPLEEDVTAGRLDRQAYQASALTGTPGPPASTPGITFTHPAITKYEALSTVSAAVTALPPDSCMVLRNLAARKRHWSTP